MKIPLFKVDADGLGLANVGLLPPAIPEQSIVSTDNALNKVSSYRGLYGALQNRMERTLTNVGNSFENLTSSESLIRDANMAAEMMKFSQQNILSQAAQAMLAQANLQPQGVLQLLK